jgi:hypothetical protein
MALRDSQKRAEMVEGAGFMRIVLGLSLLTGAFCLVPDAARAAPPALADHAAMSRALCASVVEEAGRRARYKRYGYAKRRYDWTYYPYWRPYQYRYWKYYYPYGGPLF